MTDSLASKNDLARVLARGIFETGDNPPELGGKTQRLQFMGGTYPDNEREMGGLSESALVGVLRRLLAQSPAETEARRCLAMTDEFGTQVCSLPESHGGPHAWVTPEKTSGEPT